MAEETVGVYRVEAAVSLKGGKAGVIELEITQTINDIPTARILLPLSLGDLYGKNVVVYNDEDPSNDIASGSQTYQACKDMQDGRDTISIEIWTIKATGNGGGDKSIIKIDGWRITDVSLQPQTRLSPGGVLVTAKHPMCELLESPGFFNAPGADYEKILKDKEPTNIIEAGDDMLDAIYKVISEDGYTSEKLKNQDHYEALVAGSKVRLADYIECDADANKFPYEDRFSGNLATYFKKASRLAFALCFASLPQSVPFNALLNLCNLLGLYIAPPLDGGEKAKLKVVDPWKNRKGTKTTKVPNREVYSSQTSRDTDPICGIRFIASPQDSVIISTLTDIKPVQKNAKISGGETMYYFNSIGRIINTSLPHFLYDIFSIMFRLYNKERVKTTSESTGTKASHAQYDDPKAQLKSFGIGESQAKSIIDDLQTATAKAMFVNLHRRTQRSSVTKPLIDDDFPKLGEYVSFKAGTGGDNVEGVLVQNIIRASCPQGICTVTHNMAYCGDIAAETVKGEGGSDSKKALENELWAKASSGGSGGK